MLGATSFGPAFGGKSLDKHGFNWIRGIETTHLFSGCTLTLSPLVYIHLAVS